MGKLVEKLRQVRQATGAGGGFGFLGARAAAQQPRPAAVLVSLGVGDAAAAEAAAKNGADAVLVSGWKAGADLGKISGALAPASVPWGVELGRAATADAVVAAREAGASFAVLASGLPARLLLEKGNSLDLVVAMEPPRDDMALILLRAENLLPADAMLFTVGFTPDALSDMSIGDFARMRLVFESVRFPALVTLDGDPDETQVRLLVRLGADALVLPGEGASAAVLGERIKTLRERLEKTPANEDDRSSVAIGGLMDTRAAPATAPHDPDEE